MRPSPAGTTRLSITSHDLYETRAISERLYYPLSLEVLGNHNEFGMQLDVVQTGPITIGLLSFGTEVQITTSTLSDAYEVNIPITGELLTASGADRVTATPTTAAVYRADRDSVIRGWGDDQPCRMLALKIERRALEDQLERLIGRRIAAPISFDFPLDIASGRGKEWWALLRARSAQVYDDDSLYQHPLLMAPMAQSVMLGLLMSAEHDYTDCVDRLATESPGCASAAIIRAKEYICAHIDDPLTATGIADACGLSVRALQQGFQISMQTSPMRYLRELRLRKVREDLLIADPETTSVAEIAHRWGFGHLGRFAGFYRDVYGERPSAALRSM